MDIENEVTTPVVEEASLENTEVTDSATENSLEENQETQESSTEEAQEHSIEEVQEQTEVSIEAAKDTDEDDKDDDNNNEDEKDKDPKEDEKEQEHSLEVTPVEETEAYQKLQASYNTLQTDFATLTEKCKILQEFYDKAMIAQKDALIDKFYMLSEEDKREVVEHKTEYSLEEIEAKLSVICFRKKVNFDLENSSENDINIETNSAMFTINTEDNDSTPAWIRAVDKRVQY